MVESKNVTTKMTNVPPLDPASFEKVEKLTAVVVPIMEIGGFTKQVGQLLG